MWNLRLKNALNQIDINYKTAVTMIEQMLIGAYSKRIGAYSMLIKSENKKGIPAVGMLQSRLISVDICVCELRPILEDVTACAELI